MAPLPIGIYVDPVCVPVAQVGRSQCSTVFGLPAMLACQVNCTDCASAAICVSKAGGYSCCCIALPPVKALIYRIAARGLSRQTGRFPGCRAVGATGLRAGCAGRTEAAMTVQCCVIAHKYSAGRASKSLQLKTRECLLLQEGEGRHEGSLNQGVIPFFPHFPRLSHRGRVLSGQYRCE